MESINIASLLLWVLVTSHIFPVAVCGTVPAVIVFGDSSVDSGNNNFIATVLKSNFKPYGRDFDDGLPTGRFCNGRLPPDFIAEAFGIKRYIPAYLDPAYSIKDFATGVCFASAGTGFDNETSAVLNVIPLWKEIEYYKEYQGKLREYIGEEEANEVISEALYMISIGSNDFLENYYLLPSRRAQFSVSQYQDFLVHLAENFIRELYGLGARKMVVAGLVPIGCLPLERAMNVGENHECNKVYNDVALEFNKKLENMQLELGKELPLVKLVPADAYDLFSDFIARPSFHGFEVVDKGCCSTGTFEMSYLCSEPNPLTCQDANKYLFWDGFHPTEKTYHIISEYLMIPKLFEAFQ